MICLFEFDAVYFILCETYEMVYMVLYFELFGNAKLVVVQSDYELYYIVSLVYWCDMVNIIIISL